MNGGGLKEEEEKDVRRTTRRGEGREGTREMNQKSREATSSGQKKKTGGGKKENKIGELYVLFLFKKWRSEEMEERRKSKQ